jgi:predicted regulator of amino acid metabolism with ACT domain
MFDIFIKNEQEGKKKIDRILNKREKIKENIDDLIDLVNKSFKSINYEKSILKELFELKMKMTNNIILDDDNIEKTKIKCLDNLVYISRNGLLKTLIKNINSNPELRKIWKKISIERNKDE